MADTVPIHCASCSTFLGNVAHVPGEQRLKCPDCRRVTKVTIHSNGHLDTVNDSCYVATAAITHIGVDPTGAVELDVLRAWRDQFLARSLDGRRLISEYYADAPDILAAIRRHPPPNQATILEDVYHDFVSKVVAQIRDGRHAEAEALVRRGLDQLRARLRIAPPR